MAAAPALTPAQQIKQLNDARKLVLGDPTFYPQIVQGVVPISGKGSRLEMRRWGADFLAETFAMPTIPPSEKESLSLFVLESIKDMLEDPTEDPGVIKSLVQTAASIYPLVFRWIINNAYDAPSWERMVAIKSRILRMWDTASPGVRICCIKFAQRVVLVQTAGPAADPKRGDPLEISLAMVPPSHPLIPARNLDAEAQALLDRMLSVFQENSSDAILVDATLNTLPVLIRARPQLANKILTVILNFNPLKLANSPMTPKLRVMVKSMEKTTRSLLINVNKRDPQNPLAQRIQQHIERLLRSRTDIFDESTRKRGPPEPIDGLDAAKRQKLGAQIPPPVRIHIPPLAPGPHTIGELFTISADDGLKAFDVAQLAPDLVAKIDVTILQKLDKELLSQAVNGIRQRLESMAAVKPEQLNPATAPLGVEEDEDDYEPDFSVAEDTEQILNKLDAEPTGSEEPEAMAGVPDMALGTFVLPQPPPMSFNEIMQAGRASISRLFATMQSLDEPGKKSKSGFNRLAASSNDRDAWITVITRIATRSTYGLEDASVKKEEPDHATISDIVRETLYLYVLEDFRKRIDPAVSWLCEEWYNDQISIRALGAEKTIQHYEKWALKVLDGIVPYLDAKDKVLTRFLSEIPSLNPEMLSRIKNLCRDPAMISLSITSLVYVIMFKEPAREIALDALEAIYESYEDAKPMAAKFLTKHRPGWDARLKGPDNDEAKVEGASAVATVA
ncbi:hypothetical protein BP6252_01949 [Coleophoma cylindrospora]|uniref:Symplekin/Pta1 N-terminal domain-containing protein n=1 Tax=Coleophoma cylindrospora TaxID=1849047 RepID=A0A3D8SDG7_9HELO|nr:hypothetical protein BP6252_01949 [Coleophoma cylindrospora]